MEGNYNDTSLSSVRGIKIKAKKSDLSMITDYIFENFECKVSGYYSICFQDTHLGDDHLNGNRPFSLSYDLMIYTSPGF